MRMTIERKIQLLEKLLENKEELKKLSSSDSKFKSWKSQVERTYIKVFGDDSHELKEFKKLYFFYNPSFFFAGSDDSMQHKECYRKDLELTIFNIENFINEFREELEHSDTIKKKDTDSSEENNLNSNTLKKIFISHASKDKELVVSSKNNITIHPIYISI